MLRPMRVLIIDDDEDARSALAEMLKELGHLVVSQCSSLAQALEDYQKRDPDLVTLDVAMPDADGLTVLEALRSLDAEAKVLIISGTTQKNIREALLKGGAAAILAKPYTVKALGATLDELGAVRPPKR